MRSWIGPQKLRQALGNEGFIHTMKMLVYFKDVFDRGIHQYTEQEKERELQAQAEAAGLGM